MAGSRRIRLVFKDKDGILSSSQKSEGLKRCWLLLKPQFHSSIADLSSHILLSFQLQPSCPNGLLLYMDGFCLPPFESTEILNERDVISVRKKGVTLALEGTNATNGTLLLANEEFEKECGGYQCDELEDLEEESDKCEQENQLESLKDGGNVTSKKRKALDKLNGSKKKKQCSAIHGSIQDAVTTRQIENSDQDDIHARKKNFQKLNNQLDQTHVTDDREKAEPGNNCVDTSQITKSADQSQKNGNEGLEGSAGTRKIPSRSARRKKAKRQWIREMAKIQKQAEVSQLEAHDWQNPAKAKRKNKNDWEQKPAKPDGKEEDGKPKLPWKRWSEKNNWDDKRKGEVANHNGRVYKHASQKSNLEDEVVPVVTRPGHIRFEHSDKDHAVEQSQQSGEHFQLNGVTSRRKRHKWGKEKPWYSCRKEDDEIAKARVGMSSSQNELRFDEPINFNELPPLCDLPKTGDIIGYRLIELSSSWTPELSPYQVGLVSWCSESGKLLLMRFTECPSTPKKSAENESDPQPDYSLYKADGPLEIDFKTLIDVRIVKHSIKGVAAAANGDSGGSLSASNEKQSEGSSTKNGRDLWDKFSEALSDKKTQQSQENSWGKSASSNRSSLSYRAVQGGALGPTMALLR